MSMQTQITALAQAIAADIKTLNTNQGTLGNLSTTAKNNLVTAINELKSAIDGIHLTDLINDSLGSSSTKTWSITKINTAITDAVNALVAGAPTALDTLNELAAALTSDESVISGLVTSVGNRVRFDAAQSLTSAQQVQACQNIGVGDPTTDLAAAYNTAKA